MQANYLLSVLVALVFWAGTALLQAQEDVRSASDLKPKPKAAAQPSAQTPAIPPKTDAPPPPPGTAAPPAATKAPVTSMPACASCQPVVVCSPCVVMASCCQPCEPSYCCGRRGWRRR